MRQESTLPIGRPAGEHRHRLLLDLQGAAPGTLGLGRPPGIFQHVAEVVLDLGQGVAVFVLVGGLGHQGFDEAEGTAV